MTCKKIAFFDRLPKKILNNFQYFCLKKLIIIEMKYSTSMIFPLSELK